MNTVVWAWLILAFIFAISESINADLFMLPWSAGALAAAILEALHVSSGWQWIAFFGLSSVLLVVIQRARRRRRDAKSGPDDEGPLS